MTPLDLAVTALDNRLVHVRLHDDTVQVVRLMPETLIEIARILDVHDLVIAPKPRP